MTDLITMIGNISQSLNSVQRLVSGMAYVLGLLFFLKAIQKLRGIAASGRQASSHDRMFVPAAYFLGGAALLFLPSAVSVMSNTVFGTGNVLQYTHYNPYDIYTSMSFLIRTAGVIWFIRGSVLLSHASEPGGQDGPKGLVFLVAGILSINFDTTVSYIGYVMNEVTSYTLNATDSAVK